MKYTSMLIFAVALCTAGCVTTPQASFYLVPDPDGNVGEVTVTNQAGSVTLTSANEVAAAPGADKAIEAPRQADAEEIDSKFGAAFAVMPERPQGFNIYFGSGSSEVAAESMGVVEEVMAEYRKRDSRDISLNGHTDRVGDAESNTTLSLGRAATVKALLLKQGVPAEYISVEYYGESKPVVPTADNVSEPKNRRVEVVVR